MTRSTTSGLNSSQFSAYAAITGAYWALMLTDGALRMIVLLHFHTLGYSPIQLAYMFLLYELMGMVTNLTAGWAAVRLGLATVLYAGLSLQIAALLLLLQFDPGWLEFASVLFVMGVQGLAGIAKDLAKTSAKSSVKLLLVDKESSLFRWVALLTGSKNAVKGLGFLAGAAMLAGSGFEASVIAMAVLLSVALGGAALFMPRSLKGGKRKVPFREIISKSRRINKLSLARFFLFGSRDVWFVVGIPIYFYGVLSDGTAAGDRAAFFQVGSFMACWIVGYGIVQVLVPRLLSADGRPVVDIVRLAVAWGGGLIFIPAALAALAWLAEGGENWLFYSLVGGLLAFGFVFAVNSSVHSYLILAFSKNDRVTMDVGFYYMSNAAGRFAGTLLSGLSYQFGGLALCLATAAAMTALSFLSATWLVRQD